MSLPEFPPLTDASAPRIAEWLKETGLDAEDADFYAVAVELHHQLDESFRDGYDVAVGKRPDLAARLGYRPHGDPRASS